jgi:pimeloyl-ACP methyl ester carboxylesterase
MPKIISNGIQLYYEVRGVATATPLMMIMGITAPGSVWEKHTLAFEQHFLCIIVDNRGVGQSDKPEGEYTTNQMADDYAGLMEVLKIDPAHIIGVSMGSTIAQQLAIRHPSKVKSLVLMCPWARCDNAAKAIFQHIINCKAKFDAEQFALYIQLLIYSKASWDDENVAAELAEGRKNALNDENPQPFQGLKAQAMACINHNALSDLPKIYQKTLVIGGKEDIFTPEWMANEVAENIPNSELYLYEKAGHIFHFEQLDNFNERVIKWFLAV